MQLDEPDLIRWALKRARALPGERDLELVHEKLSSGGFGDGEGMWVALRTSHFLCCKSCPLVRGDGIAFGSTVKDRHSVTLQMILEEELQAEKTSRICIYSIESSSAPSKMDGSTVASSNLRVCLLLCGVKFKDSNLSFSFRRMLQTTEPLDTSLYGGSLASGTHLAHKGL